MEVRLESDPLRSFREELKLWVFGSFTGVLVVSFFELDGGLSVPLGFWSMGTFSSSSSFVRLLII